MKIGRFDAKSWFWRPPVVTNGFASKNCAFEIGNVSGALTGTRFVPIFDPNMSGMILAVNFFDPTPQVI